ncbi:DUF3526 domain-containing protein [Acanthopleuribacter pedis]|uniref:DUF3526 domain-containing protein n=1 Tax=Acanthopleuribacter pedis TaxID=442870 RepID=A0A8J7Q7F8_9BACT|nr:DUF3526 domain-containing protein [Acanthopleuribacter pedis]
MFWNLFLKECRLQWREKRFVWSLVVLLLLAVPAVAVGFAHYRSDLSEVEAGAVAERERWVQQGPKNPHSAAHYGIFVFRPVSPLRVWDQGITPFAGGVVFTEAHIKTDASYETAQDQSTLSRFGSLTPAFVLLYLVPLFLMINGFALISGEREQGTLRLLSASAADPRRLLAAKWLSLFPIVLLVGGVMLGLGLVLLWGRLPAANLLTASALCALVLLLYYGTIANMTLLCSAVLRSSHQVLVCLLLFWMTSSLVVPKLAASAAESWFPTPDREAFHGAMKQEKKSGMDGHDPADQRVARIRTETLAKYGVEKEEDLPINIDGLLMQEDENYGNKVFDRYYEELAAVHAQQERVFQWSSLLSPLLPARVLSMTLAGADSGTQHRFNEAVEVFRRDYVELLNTDMMHESRSGDWRYQADEGLWSRVPVFTFDFGSPLSRFATQSAALGMLLLWFLITGVLTAWLAPKFLQKVTP